MATITTDPTASWNDYQGNTGNFHGVITDRSPIIPDPSQWAYPSMLAPLMGQGTAQQQQAANPRVAPNLGFGPLGMDGGKWSKYVAAQGQDRSADPQSALSAVLSPQDAQSYVTQQYKDLLGRAPDAAGQQYWTAQGGNPQQLTNDMMNTPEAQAYRAKLDPSGFMNWMDQGQKAVAGINRMPYTFSNYAGVPGDPTDAAKMLYQNATINQPPAGGGTAAAAPDDDDINRRIMSVFGPQGPADYDTLRATYDPKQALTQASDETKAKLAAPPAANW